jgi:hypothetical protein
MNKFLLLPAKGLCFVLLFAGAMVLSVFNQVGCDPGKITSDTTAVNTPIPTEKASITITNLKLKNPGTLTFKLWEKLAVEALQSNPVSTIGKVETDSTRIFSIPTGTWKLGYVTEDDQRVEMPDPDSTGEKWPQVTFVKDGNYHLTVYTNAVNNITYWSHNLLTVK